VQPPIPPFQTKNTKVSQNVLRKTFSDPLFNFIFVKQFFSHWHQSPNFQKMHLYPSLMSSLILGQAPQVLESIGNTGTRERRSQEGRHLAGRKEPLQRRTSKIDSIISERMGKSVNLLIKVLFKTLQEVFDIIISPK
jgi:hypothetical protein